MSNRPLAWALRQSLERLANLPAAADLTRYRELHQAVKLSTDPGILELAGQLDHALRERAEQAARAARVLEAQS